MKDCRTPLDGILVHDKGVIVEVNDKCAEIFGLAPVEMIGRSILDLTAPAPRGPSVENEARYLDLIEQSRYLICTHDLEGRILSVNAAAARALDMSPDELRTMTVRDILAPEAQPLFDTYAATLRRDGFAEGKMEVMTRDGQIRVWEYQNVLRTIGLAEPVVHGVARDVTDREEALRALRNSEEHFRSIIENASDIISIIDPTGVINYHSPSFERALGYARNELTASRLLDLVHPEDVERVAHFIINQSTGHNGKTIRLRLRHRTGTWRSFEAAAKSLRRDGSVHSIVINARDITESELLARQLEQAHRVNGLGRLAATVAHEFNNVLMGMQPFAELLQRPDASPAVLEKCARHIANSIQRGKRVALDILRFTQPAAPVLKPVNLVEWWAELAPELQGQIGNHITFAGQFSKHVNVIADYAQLAQVFANLVSNARDAMPRKGTLDISMRQPQSGEQFSFGVVNDPSSFVQISVADTGTGIPEDIVGHVFDPLFTTKESGGTGLGLAVAHQIITRHGGYIFVESRVGVGSTFHIFLPKMTGPVETEPQPLTRPETFRAKRILIVDDEELIVEGISELLICEGFTVGAVRTGGEAVSAVERFAADVVVLDLGLPDIDGLEVGKRLRAAYPTLPIIFTSGHGDRARVEGDPLVRFLQKPFDLDVLLAAIADVESPAGA